MTKYCCHVAGAKLQMTLARDYQANPLFGDYRIQILSEIKLNQCGMQSRESVEGKIKFKPIRVQAKAIGWPELTDHVYVCVCVCVQVCIPRISSAGYPAFSQLTWSQFVSFVYDQRAMS